MDARDGVGRTASRITADDFMTILRTGMPTATATPFDIVTLEHGLAILHLTTSAQHTRPGGSVAGPVLFWLADLAMYAAVLSVVGVVPLAVTTDATIHFLRRPAAGPLVARAHVLKKGQRLIVGDIHITQDHESSSPVAHVVMTYSVPTAPNG
jgi:uncharacterized protein (TIGR00369 family)